MTEQSKILAGKILKEKEEFIERSIDRSDDYDYSIRYSALQNLFWAAKLAELQLRITELENLNNRHITYGPIKNK